MDSVMGLQGLVKENTREQYLLGCHIQWQVNVVVCFAGEEGNLNSFQFNLPSFAAEITSISTTTTPEKIPYIVIYVTYRHKATH